MKKLLITIIFLLAVCEKNPVVNENVKNYNLFLVLRQDKEVQELHLSKVYVITDTIIDEVEARAKISTRDTSFQFERQNGDIFTSFFKPVSGETYILQINGECGDLEIKRKMPDEFFIIYPEEGDSLTIDDTVKVLNSDDIAAYEILIMDSSYSYDSGLLPIVDKEDTIMFPLKELFYEISPSDSSVLKVIGMDSLYLNYWLSDMFSGSYDTLQSYYGIFTGMIVKEINVIFLNSSISQ